MGFSLRNARLVQHVKIYVIYHIKKIKDKNYMIISIDTEKKHFTKSNTFL